MLIYDLICDHQHKFEAWFKSVDDYQVQLQSGMLNCPICDSAEVKKIPSASYISMGSQKKQTDQETTVTQSKPGDISQAVSQLRHFLETQSEDVGSQFVEEAKKIHYGETEKRNIHGTATMGEVIDLHEDGVDVLPLPLNIVDKKQLN